MACPDASEIDAFVARRLQDSQAIEDHLENCSSCRELVLTLARSSPASDDDTLDAGASGEPIVGRAIGRYLVSRMLGAGGMGVVYAAWDPQLERKVAVKLLRPNPTVPLETLRVRMVREAQAMAKLSHPNVITVYEVGRFGEQIFVAMEYIDGATLGAWLRERDRSWREIVDALAAAGEGLAAAHHAGLIHRDFKPENVLVGKDGRICVTDFGLARSRGGDEKLPAPTASAQDPLTRTGALVGTPAYMAPEQLAAGACDERSDLFSFCVALYEALFRVRPFAGASVEEVRQHIEAGPTPPPSGARVPGWVTAVMLRGLAPDPARRPASMRELVDALKSDPRAKWWRRAVAAAFIALLAVSIALGAQQLHAMRHRCDGGAKHLAGVWDAARRDRVRAVLGGATLADAVVGHIDRYADQWVEGYRDACEATRLRNEQSESLLDLRMQCLGDRLRDLDALAGVLVVDDKELRERAPRAVAELPALSSCEKSEAAKRMPLPGDPVRRAAVEKARASAAEARALYSTGRTRQSLAVAEEVLALAEPRDPEAQTVALFARAVSLERLERTEEAIATYRLAAENGLRTQNYSITAQVWINLTRLTGYLQLKIDEALKWAALAKAIAVPLPDHDRLELSRLLALAAAFDNADREVELEAVSRQAVALAERILPSDEAQLAQAYDSLSAALARKSESMEEAARYGRKAVATMEKAGLAGTTLWAQPAYNLALTLENLERYDETIEITKKTLAIDAGEFGDVSLVASAELTLASAYCWQRRWAEAAPILERLAPRVERFRDSMPHQVPEVFMYLGMLRAAQGREQEATAIYQKALADKDLYPTSDRATVEFGLARIFSKRDRQRALALGRAAKEHVAKDPVPNATLARQIDEWLLPGATRSTTPPAPR